MEPECNADYSSEDDVDLVGADRPPKATDRAKGFEVVGSYVGPTVVTAGSTDHV